MQVLYNQISLLLLFLKFKHASSDVEKMVLGNKCDINDKRQVSKERGEKVRCLSGFNLIEVASATSDVCNFSSISFQLALEYGIKFMETSAKANINVENVSSCLSYTYCWIVDLS